MLCKNYSLEILNLTTTSISHGISGEVVMDELLGRNTLPTEISWMSPMQEESEKLQRVSPNNDSLISVKKHLEADPLFTHPFFILFTVLSCFGNLAIITLVSSFPKFRKKTNLLVANLSVCSLLLMISVNIRYMEFYIDLWNYTGIWCRALAVIHRIPVPLVALTLMAISFDRGRVARNPLTRTCSIHPFWRIVLIWSFSFLIAFPLAFGRKHDPCIYNAYKCAKTLIFNSTVFTVAYSLVFLSSVYLIPSYILIQESTKTLRKIRFLRASIVAWSGNRIGMQLLPTFPDTRLRLLRNSCIFSIIFLVFWVPYGFAQFLLDLPQSLLPDILVAYTQFYVKFLKNFTYIQVVLNPVILFALSYDFGIYCKRFKVKCPSFV